MLESLMVRWGEMWTVTLAGAAIGLLFGAVWLVAALVWARRQRVRFWSWFGAIGVGVVVACAWLLTWAMSRQAFDLVVPVQSLSFTGPAADTLMLVLSPPGQPLKFDLGLVPGVAAGGCAVGAGVSGAAVFTLTSWATLSAMWGAAMLTDRLLDQPKEAAQPVPAMSPHGDPELSASYARP